MSEFSESESFHHADRRIEQMLDKFKAKGMCGCCVSKALLLKAIDLAEEVFGSIEAAEMFEVIAANVRGNNLPARYPHRVQH